jgi:hypothetical protein
MSEGERVHTDDITTERLATAADTAAVDLGWSGLLGDTGDFASRWQAIQAGFVDEPRRAVEEADSLVAEVIQRLASSFSDERSRLEQQWSRGDQVGTEDLRVALQRYRAFFDELLGSQSDRRAS